MKAATQVEHQGTKKLTTLPYDHTRYLGITTSSLGHVIRCKSGAEGSETDMFGTTRVPEVLRYSGAGLLGNHRNSTTARVPYAVQNCTGERENGSKLEGLRYPGTP